MEPDRIVRSTCPYCGVGCQVLLNIKDDRIRRVEAPFNAAPNYGRLCVKGQDGETCEQLALAVLFGAVRGAVADVRTQQQRQTDSANLCRVGGYHKNNHCLLRTRIFASLFQLLQGNCCLIRGCA